MKNRYKILLLILLISSCVIMFFLENKRKSNLVFNEVSEIFLSKNSELLNKEVETNKNYIKNKEKNTTKNEKINNMSPEEYIKWLKEPNDRVLLEVKKEGTSLYRKGNVTIIVMGNGKELYMPDEL